MREIRQSGSEGGAAQTNASSLPLSAAIETDMIDRFAGEEGSDMRTGLTALHPVGSIGKADEIADAVLYLASDAASFVTGTSLKVDGGFLAQ